MQDEIIVSNWGIVHKDDFYLSDEWAETFPEEVKDAKKLLKEDDLFVGYIVPAVTFAIYSTMDAFQVFINGAGEVILHCESAVIDRKQEYRAEYDMS